MGSTEEWSISITSRPEREAVAEARQRDAGGSGHADREPQRLELLAQVGQVDLQRLGADVHLTPHAGPDLGAFQAPPWRTCEEREDLELLGRERVGPAGSSTDGEGHGVQLEVGRGRVLFLQEVGDALDLEPQLAPTRRCREILGRAEGVALADPLEGVHPTHRDPRARTKTIARLGAEGIEDRLPVGSQIRDPQEALGVGMHRLECSEGSERGEEAHHVVGGEDLLVPRSGLARVQDADRGHPTLHAAAAPTPMEAMLRVQSQ